MSSPREKRKKKAWIIFIAVRSAADMTSISNVVIKSITRPTAVRSEIKQLNKQNILPFTVC